MSHESSERLSFDSVHNEFRQRILRYLERMVGPGEAEELTQEVFLKVSQALDGFRSESKLSTWIYRIATNVALDRLRSTSFSHESGAISAEESEIAGGLQDKDVWSGEEKPAVIQSLIRREMDECIRGLVEQLPEEYRTVLVLSEFEGLKDREIADVLVDSLQAVKIRLHRARVKLKAALESNCSFFRDERNVFGCEPKPIEGIDPRPKK